MLQRSPRTRPGRQDFGDFLLRVRRFAIFAIMVMAYFYYRALGNTQLAAIGLLSFAAIAQLAPAFFGGLFWRRATARGAMGGMLVGVAVWIYTLFLPSFLESSTAGLQFLQHGPFGIEALRPRALFGADLPPLMHGVLWSLSLNILTYVVLSMARQPSSIERLQADLFVPSTLTPITPTFRRWRTTVTVQDIQSTVAQYLGPDRARQAFEAFAAGHPGHLDPAAPADFELLQHAEHLIASSIGAASSRLVMSLLLRKRTVSAKAALKLLDDSHAALHFNREILQTALNHVRQGIAVFDADLQLICSNAQFGEILALPPHLVQLGIPLREILEFMDAVSPPGSGDSDALLERRLTAYTTEGEPYLERLPDRHMVIEVRSNRMPGGGLVITFSDVTPSFEAAEALERANATLEKRVRDRTEELTRLNSELAQAKSTAEDANISKTRFLAAASHDILQPLNAARLYVTSLVERQSGGEDSRLVENIDDSLEAIEEILGALLDISRLDAGAMTTSITSFRMGDLMRSLEIEFAPIARAKGLKLTFVPCSLPVESDRALLRRLLQNFISNAIKYTPRGRVLVGCRRHGQSLQIGVYDTGVGIPVQKRGEIFKEFHRLEQGARIARGLGLGLSIVERLARVLNHGIALDANAGGGSVFSVTVPVAKAVNYTAAVTSATPLSDADERRADRLHRERSGDPRRHEDAADGVGRRGDRGDRSRGRDRGDRGLRRQRHRPAGRLSSRPRQRRRRDPRDPPPFRRQHSGDPDHGGPQPEGAGGRARGKYRGAQQAGQTGLAARAARPVAHPAAGGGGGVGARPQRRSRMRQERVAMPRHQFIVAPTIRTNSGSSKFAAVVTAPGRDHVGMSKARSYPDRRDACGRGGLNAGAGIFERNRQGGCGTRRAQTFQIRHWMRLAVGKFVADDERLEPIRDPKSGQQHLGIQPRRVGHRDHGDAGAIRARKQRHQAGQWLDFPGNELAEGCLLLADDRRLARRRFLGEKPRADRGVGEALKLFAEARVIEDVTAGAEDLIERFQMKRIGVGQRAVNVEQQRFP